MPAGTELNNTNYWESIVDMTAVSQRMTQKLGNIETSVTQIQSTVGKAVLYVTPEMYGAVGDYSKDDAEAVQAAVDSGLPVKMTGRYLMTSPVKINRDHVVIEGRGAEIRVRGNFAFKIEARFFDIQIGKCSDVNGSISNQQPVFPVGSGFILFDADFNITKDDKYWYSYGYGNVWIGEASLMQYGIRVIPATGDIMCGLEYCTFSGNDIYCERCISLEPSPGAADAWANQNTFTGFRLRGRHGIYIDSSSRTSVNNNTFTRCGLEGILPGGAGIYCNCVANSFIDLRNAEQESLGNNGADAYWVNLGPNAEFNRFVFYTLRTDLCYITDSLYQNVFEGILSDATSTYQASRNIGYTYRGCWIAPDCNMRWLRVTGGAVGLGDYVATPLTIVSIPDGSNPIIWMSPAYGHMGIQELTFIIAHGDEWATIVMGANDNLIHTFSEAGTYSMKYNAYTGGWDVTKIVEYDSDAEEVTPERFGAVGDGNTDDTAAFQAAIRYLSARNGGVLKLYAKRYAVNELYFANIKRAITIEGRGRSGNTSALIYGGNDYCLNIHGCTHLFIRDLAICARSTITAGNNGAIRYYDRDTGLSSGYTDPRTNDSIVSNVLISGFACGVSVDSPCGYIKIDDVSIESIQAGGHAVRVGKNYNVAHYDSQRYNVNPNYIYINKLMCNGNEYGSEREDALFAAVGIYRASQVFITNCDICNIKTGWGVYIDDSKGFVNYVHIEQNEFYNVQKAVYAEMLANDSSRVVANIHSRNNHYFMGSYAESVPLTIRGNAARTISGFSSIGDIFSANVAGLCKYMYDLEYARNIRLSDYTITPENTGIVNLWDTTLYRCENVSNIFGLKAKTYEVSATTESNGTITLTTDFRLWTNTPYVLTNVRDTASTQYEVTVNAITNKSIILRVRDSAGAAVANTAVQMTITLIGT